MTASVSDNSTVPCDVKVCRICFTTDMKLCLMRNDNTLYNAYETITAVRMKNDDKLPPYLCIECSHQLLNYSRFRTKSKRAHAILLEIINKYDRITEESIQLMKSNLLNGNFGCIDLTTSDEEDVNIDVNEDVTPSLGQQDTDDLKTERDDVINGAVLSDANGIDVSIRISTLVEDVGIDEVTTNVQATISNQDDDVNQNITVDEKPSEGEDYSSDDCLPLKEVRHKIKRISREVKEVSEASEVFGRTKNTLQNSRTDGFLNKHVVLNELFKTSSGRLDNTVCIKNCTALKKKNIEVHTNEHLDEKSDTCDLLLCNDTFSGNKTLQRHFKKHIEKNVYHCDNCGKTFSKKYQIKLHMRIHSSVKPYPSVSAFVVKSNNLRESAINQTGLKLLQTGSDKKTHLGEKTYPCDNTIIEKNNLQKSVIKHTGLKVLQSSGDQDDNIKDPVGVKYSVSNYKTLHENEKTHLGEKSYLSDNAFTERSDLQEPVIEKTGLNLSQSGRDQVDNLKDLVVINSCDCGTCNCNTLSENDLVYHKTTQLDDKSNPCKNVFTEKSCLQGPGIDQTRLKLLRISSDRVQKLKYPVVKNSYDSSGVCFYKTPNGTDLAYHPIPHLREKTYPYDNTVVENNNLHGSVIKQTGLKLLETGSNEVDTLQDPVNINSCNCRMCNICNETDRTLSENDVAHHQKTEKSHPCDNTFTKNNILEAPVIERTRLEHSQTASDQVHNKNEQTHLGEKYYLSDNEFIERRNLQEPVIGRTRLNLLESGSDQVDNLKHPVIINSCHCRMCKTLSEKNLAYHQTKQLGQKSYTCTNVFTENNNLQEPVIELTRLKHLQTDSDQVRNLNDPVVLNQIDYRVCNYKTLHEKNEAYYKKKYSDEHSYPCRNEFTERSYLQEPVIEQTGLNLLERGSDQGDNLKHPVIKNTCDCRMCKTRSEKNLAYHQTTQLGQKSYQCGNAFTERINLQEPVIEQTGLNLLESGIDQGDILKHPVIKNSCDCRMCKTMSEKNLAHHQTTQLGQKSYPCGNAFTERINLQEPVIEHTGLKNLQTVNDQVLNLNDPVVINPIDYSVCNYKTLHENHFTYQRELFWKKSYPCDNATMERINLQEHAIGQTGLKLLQTGSDQEKNLNDLAVMNLIDYSVCNHKTLHDNYFGNHQKKNVGGKSYLCDNAFTEKSNLQEPAIEQIGLKVLQTGNYQVDNLKDPVVEKSYKCSVCNYKALHKKNLALHQSKHLNEKAYSSDSALDEKNNLQGPAIKQTELIPKETGRDQVDNLKDDVVEKSYSCSICNYKAHDKKDLTHHKKTHLHEKAYSSDTGLDEKNNLQEPAIKQTQLKPKETGRDQVDNLKDDVVKKSYSCSICNYKAHDKKDLAHHKKTHLHAKAYSSDTGLNEKNNLQEPEIKQTQLKLRETGRDEVDNLKDDVVKKSYKCSVCNYKAHDKKDLAHHKKTHLHEKAYSSDTGLDEKNNLQEPAIKQTELKPKETGRDQVDILKDDVVKKSYSCSICNYKAHDKKNLAHHKKTHLHEKAYACDSAVNEKNNLQGPAIKKTELKPKETGRDQVDNLNDDVTEKSYSCSICNYKAHDKKDLEHHKESHLDETPPCDSALVVKSNNLQELTTAQTGVELLQTGNDQVDNLRDATLRKSYNCNMCYYSIHDKQQIKTHKNTHFGTSLSACDKCKKAFSVQRHLDTHVQTHKPSFTCDICNESFSGNSHLQRHLKNHNGLNLYHCDQCGETFAKKYQIKLHTRRHSTMKPYPSVSTLVVKRNGLREPAIKQTELKLTETGKDQVDNLKNDVVKEPYKCSVCNYTALDKKDLAHHKKTHLDEKGYSCDICKKVFRLHRYLQTHLQTHKLSFKCDVCNESFSENIKLQRHQKQHHIANQYKCDHCGKIFRRKVQFRLHLRIHNT